jgi:MFS family permease
MRGAVLALALSMKQYRWWSFRQATCTRQFWELGLLHFCRCLCHAIPLVHIVPSAIRTGLAPTTMASVLGTIGICSFLRRIGWGILADRWGPKPAYLLAVVQQGIMVSWLLWARDPMSFLLFAILWRIGYGGAMPPYALFVKGYYGLKSFGAICGSSFLPPPSSLVG